ncbi:hypothetical protein [Aliarcobacter butzleri]|uniref:hypothetical protein n=1 Tax=Aliarcobacter butzleri TaxID=28197 RepID=UPI00263F3454|nr:hypothetical protein [Aliarcobacter butzleri]MDN5067878.1 hypothetical protein [Aliarcobacter butzleri]MDN5072720.1 hypothetical protein [Aliarcobacter butzleri]MDN5121698.1 hypothetical protein [Aliarcobacter butzleri]
MKIVFMPMLPLTQKDYEYLGIKYFFENGFDVTILETHQLLLSGYADKVQLNYFNFKNTITPSGESELLNFTKKLTDQDFIFYYLASKEAIILLNKIKASCKVKFVTFVSGSIPQTSSPCGALNVLKRKIMPYLRNIQYFFGIRTFHTDYYFTGAPKDEIVYPYLKTKKSKHIKIHSRDYENCLKIEKFSNHKPYCVYLDTDIINASDYEISGKSYRGIHEYQKKLVSYFQWIEQNFSVEVIISAHPKSRIYKNKYDFNGFKVVHNQSAELVKGCDFLINEGTTAISFGIFFNKAMIFFTMNEIEFFYNNACSFGKVLNKKILNIDNLGDNLLIQMRNELSKNNRYDYYRYNYLTYKDTYISNFELIKNELMNGR